MAVRENWEWLCVPEAANDKTISRKAAKKKKRKARKRSEISLGAQPATYDEEMGPTDQRLRHDESISAISYLREILCMQPVTPGLRVSFSDAQHPRLKGGGPHYIIDAQTGALLCKRYEQYSNPQPKVNDPGLERCSPISRKV